MDKVRNSLWLPLLLTVALFVTGCGSGGGSSQSSSPSQPDYKSTKAMVLDILQTDDAKKAVANMMKDEKFKANMAIDSSTLRTTMIQTLGNPKSPHMKQMFENPKFTTQLAKSMKDENKKLMKDLMKDPEYQKMMVSVMKDPEFEKNMMDLMKSSAYRKQTMQVMKESLQSPLFQADMMKLMTKATEEATKPKTTEKKGAKTKGKGKKGKGGGGGSSK
ncbi:spore germination lipoprotein GerD [Brevibacillus sp. B_LB10_24]|uniref:spore germination lipoprotein GerD n=1 Tax=Brevibacillus sp. B_LB10_24 TaxID=3380645 RepID=UPI0038BA1613